jgi:hypothetical protein
MLPSGFTTQTVLVCSNNGKQDVTWQLGCNSRVIVMWIIIITTIIISFFHSFLVQPLST